MGSGFGPGGSRSFRPVNHRVFITMTTASTIENINRAVPIVRVVRSYDGWFQRRSSGDCVYRTGFIARVWAF